MIKADRTQDRKDMQMPPSMVTGAPSSEPTNDQVSSRAYELFLARGAEHGHDLEDWIQAERELRSGKN